MILPIVFFYPETKNCSDKHTKITELLSQIKCSHTLDGTKIGLYTTNKIKKKKPKTSKDGIANARHKGRTTLSGLSSFHSYFRSTFYQLITFRKTRSPTYSLQNNTFVPVLPSSPHRESKHLLDFPEEGKGF